LAGNHLDEAIGGWCPSCRTAFRPGYERCADCDVELVDELPALPPRRRLDAEPGDAIEYELADWRDDERDGLTLLLQVSEVPFTWVGTVLTVPPAAEAEVDALVDEIDGGADLSPDDAWDAAIPEEHEFEPDEAEAEVAGMPLAGAWARFWGAVFEGLVIGSAVAAVRRATGNGVAEPLSAAYVVLTTVLWGKQLGKLLAGTRIVDAESGDLPGWEQAVLRWAVVGAPGVLLAAWPSAATAGVFVVWTVAVYAPVLWGPWHRGLHDRAAGTVVVFSRRS
jgi:uncharacterized RDD family membrane protein YckC